ncbi:3-oxoacid CoA-transferase subunit A [Candidatus Epulonipiscium viviparus]|uniref:3-oxoacid CoA-transferase subunit A n=1 Tax=Candidatus Epulonipiscium viviparus TaxID=420336 RepID=UPI00016C0C83|nr:3-oxoacid CoA-transferase subunit A [Candidatus Epulopiscium viviparus]
MKIIEIDELKNLVKDSMTVMVNGFMGCGTPHKVIDKLLELGVKDLTLICNDTALADYGVGKMVTQKRFSKILASHVGLNPETAKQLNANETEVHLIPQGTLVERIRSGGAGLGGFLTPTGLGTVAEEGKQIIEVDGQSYLLELPLRADVALIGAHIVDKKGNCYYRGSTRNFGPVMATAADVVIVEADKIVEVGELTPESIVTPHIFVDYVIDGGAN